MTSSIDPEWMRRGQWPTKWVSQSFYNGIPVYREQEKDGGAYMCHTVIRASPKEVFDAVQRFEVRRPGRPGCRPPGCRAGPVMNGPGSPDIRPRARACRWASTHRCRT